MIRVAAILILTASPALATVGNDDELATLCYDAGANAVRWVTGEANRGYTVHQKAIGGASQRLGTFDDSGAWLRETELFGKRCARLADAIDLTAAAVVAVGRATGDVRASFDGPDGLVRPLMAVERPRCSYVLTFTQLGEDVGTAEIESCCGAREVRVQGFPLPTGDVALVLSFVGKCFESGYSTHAVTVLRACATKPEERIRADRYGQVPRDDAGDPRGQITVTLPAASVDFARLFGDAGFRAYQQGSYSVAIEYFDAAYQRSQESIPDLEVLFNLAATQSKAGHVEAALASLRKLMSFAGQRGRFLARIQSDSDFDPMRAKPQFARVTKPETCCAWSETVETNVDCWIDHCPAGGVHTETHRQLEYRDGRQRIVEQTIHIGDALVQVHHDDGEFVEKYASGRDRERGRFVGGQRHGEWMLWTADGSRVSRAFYRDGNKHGIETEWYPDGMLRAERTWRQGVLHGRAVEWYPSGEKRSEEVYSAGERHGPVSKWYDNGKRELAGRMENGRASGVWTTWSREDGSRIRVEVHVAGCLRFRCNYSHFDGELRDARRCDGIYYDDQGKRARSGLVLDGKPSGAWKQWNDAGTRVVRTIAAPDDRPLSSVR